MTIQRTLFLAIFSCCALFVLTAAGPTYTGTIYQGNVNANGYSLTNAATLSATNSISAPTITSTNFSGVFTGSAAALTNFPSAIARGSNTYATLTLSGPGTNTLLSARPFNEQTVTVSAGSGAYTNSLVLSGSGASTGDFYEFNLATPASTNAVVQVYSGSTGGTLLSTHASTATAGNTTLSYAFDGANWIPYKKGAALLMNNLSDLPSASTARTNLGLGTAATSNATAFAPATSGTNILAGNGTGGTAAVAIGTGLALSASNTLSVTGTGGGGGVTSLTLPSAFVVSGTSGAISATVNLDKTGEITTHPIPANSIVIDLGDSITYGVGSSGANKPWPAQLSGQAGFAGITTLNYGVSGTVAGPASGTVTGTLTSGSPIVLITAGTMPGSNGGTSVTGTGIPSSTTVISVRGPNNLSTPINSFTMSANATASGSQTISFTNTDCGAAILAASAPSYISAVNGVGGTSGSGSVSSKISAAVAAGGEVYVTVCFGANDIDGESLASFKTNVQALCTTLHGYSSHVHLVGHTISAQIPAAGLNSLSGTLNSWNNMLRGLVGTGSSGFDYFADYGAYLCDPNDTNFFATSPGPGLHPSDAGYGVIAAVMAKAILNQTTLPRFASVPGWGLMDQSNVLAADVNARKLYATDGITPRVDFANGIYSGFNGTLTFSSGAAYAGLLSASGNPLVTGNITPVLWDGSGTNASTNVIVDQTHQYYGPNGTALIQYNSGAAIYFNGATTNVSLLDGRGSGNLTVGTATLGPTSFPNPIVTYKGASGLGGYDIYNSTTRCYSVGMGVSGTSQDFSVYDWVNGLPELKLSPGSGTSAIMTYSGSYKQGAVTSAVLKADSTGKLVAATAGTDFVGLASANTLSGTNTFTTPVSVLHLIGGSAAPTIAAGSGAGTSPTFSAISGSDLSGKIAFTTGTTPSASSTVATITFASAYGAAPHVMIVPHNANADLLSGTTQVASRAISLCAGQRHAQRPHGADSGDRLHRAQRDDDAAGQLHAGHGTRAAGGHGAARRRPGGGRKQSAGSLVGGAAHRLGRAVDDERRERLSSQG